MLLLHVLLALSAFQWSGRNPYSTLGIPSSANEAEIKRAIRKAKAAAHPDRGGAEEGATDRFAAIQEAGDILLDPARRQSFDTTGHPEGTQAHPFHGFTGFHTAGARPIPSKAQTIGDPATWNSLTSLTSLTLIHFYSPMSYRCVKVAPLIDRLVASLQSVVTVGRVDVGRAASAAALAQVGSVTVPSLIAAVDGGFHQYHGDWVLRDIAQWVNGLLPREAVVRTLPTVSSASLEDASLAAGRRVQAVLFSRKANHEPSALALAAGVEHWNRVSLVYAARDDPGFAALAAVYSIGKTLPALVIDYDNYLAGAESAAQPTVVTTFDRAENSLREVLARHGQPTVPHFNRDTYTQYCAYDRERRAGSKSCLLVLRRGDASLASARRVQQELGIGSGVGATRRGLGNRVNTVTILFYEEGEHADFFAGAKCDRNKEVLVVNHFAPDKVRCAGLTADKLSSVAQELKKSGWPKKSLGGTAITTTKVPRRLSPDPFEHPLPVRWWLRRHYNTAYTAMFGASGMSSVAGTLIVGYIIFFIAKQLFFPPPPPPPSAARPRGTPGAPPTGEHSVFRWLELRRDRIDLFMERCAGRGEFPGKLLLVTLERAARDPGWFENGQFVHTISASARGRYLEFAWVGAGSAPDLMGVLTDGCAPGVPLPRAFVVHPGWERIAVLYTEEFRSKGTVTWLDRLLTGFLDGTLNLDDEGHDGWREAAPVLEALALEETQG